MQVSQECAHCMAFTKCRKRDFSEQAWSALLVWGEIDREVVDQPMCDSCYDDLREILIDRSDEIAEAQNQPIPERKPNIKREAIAMKAKPKTAAKPKAVVSKPVAKKKAAPQKAVKGKGKKSARVA